LSTSFCTVAGVDVKESQTADIVVRKDYAIGKNWVPSRIMGRDFWHIVPSSATMEDKKFVHFILEHPSMKELADKPLFKECGWAYHFGSLTVSQSNKVSISAIGPVYEKLIETKSSNVPFFFHPNRIRPVYKLMKNFECDSKNYDTWKKEHPNFMGCVADEICNDLLSSAPWKKDGYFKLEKIIGNDKELMVNIEREFPKPQNREELTAQFMKGCNAFRKYFFNDADKVSYMFEASCLAHNCYESGSSVGWFETTNTGWGNWGYRHQAALFFERGAARQYNKNWAWYIATFYNGYDDRGIFQSNAFPNYIASKLLKEYAQSSSSTGAGTGMSLSLYLRDLYLAYLSGATFGETENWFGETIDI
jgi:hypothetical protein